MSGIDASGPVDLTHEQLTERVAVALTAAHRALADVVDLLDEQPLPQEARRAAAELLPDVALRLAGIAKAGLPPLLSEEDRDGEESEAFDAMAVGF